MAKNTVTQKQIDDLFLRSEKEVFTSFDKCFVMVCRLPNGFVLVESSACVDPANYNPDIGQQICEERIKNRLWELEGYRLQCQIGGETDAEN